MYIRTDVLFFQGRKGEVLVLKNFLRRYFAFVSNIFAIMFVNFAMKTRVFKGDLWHFLSDYF